MYHFSPKYSVGILLIQIASVPMQDTPKGLKTSWVYMGHALCLIRWVFVCGCLVTHVPCWNTRKVTISKIAL